MIFTSPERVLKKILRRTNGTITVDSTLSEKRRILVRVLADEVEHKAVLVNTKSKYLVALKVDEAGKYMLNDRKDEVLTETIHFERLRLFARWA